MKNLVYFKICDNKNNCNKTKQHKIVFRRTIDNLIKYMNNYKFKLMLKYNWIEKIYKDGKQIYVIYMEKESDRKNIIEEKEIKILKKINKKIIKTKNEDKNIKIILSKQIKSLIQKHKNVHRIEQLKEILLDSICNKDLYKETLETVVKKVIQQKNEIPEEQSVYVLINSNSNQYMPLIRKLIKNYKMLNIVTKNVNQFKTFEENAEKNFELVSILNNKRKSISKAKYIINIDFKNEELLEYYINRTAIIFNIKDNESIKLNNFDGVIINNININKSTEEFNKKDYYEEVKNKKFPSNVFVKPYIEGLTGLMKKTDLMVSRAGASTLSEIIALKVPSILIPSPYVTNNHQYKNALDLINRKACVLLEEKDLKGDILVRKIDEVLSDKNKISEMKKGLETLYIKDSAEKIYQIIKEISGEKNGNN